MNATFDGSRTWIVTRHGSNAANQSMTPKLILGSVEAETETEARELASAEFHCYANQFLSLEHFNDAGAEACNEAFEADRVRSVNEG